jgi:hypothetical protein
VNLKRRKKYNVVKSGPLGKGWDSASCDRRCYLVLTMKIALIGLDT